MTNGSLVLDREKIKALRWEKGWSQAKLADESGLSVETIGLKERGEPCYPDTAAFLAAALGVRVDDLLLPDARDKSALGGPDRQSGEGIVARLDLRIWNGEGAPPGGFVLTDGAGVPPLVEGDLARIEVAIDRSAYTYLFWIDAQGRVKPVYPRRKHGQDRWPDPSDQVPIEQIELPERGFEAAGDAYSICGPEGMETVVLLLNEPGPPEFDFNSDLPEFPCQEGLPACTAVARFEYPSARPTRRTRGIGEKTKRIPDPVFQIQTALRKSLGPYFTKILAISFPNAG